MSLAGARDGVIPQPWRAAREEAEPPLVAEEAGLWRTGVIPGHRVRMLREPPENRAKGVDGVAREDSGPGAAPVAAWFGLRAEDRGAAAVALHALRGRAAHIVAARCRCGIAVADDHVADAYLCGVARNEW